MKKLVLVLFVSILLLYRLAVAERISEIKCREYSHIISSETDPHIVNLQVSINGRTVGFHGVLISDQYILTTASFEHNDLSIDLRSYSIGYELHNNIVKMYTHSLYKGYADYNLALLQLEQKVHLDDLHKPACLWTDLNPDISEHEYLRQIVGTSLPILSKSKCSYRGEENSLIFCRRSPIHFGHRNQPEAGSPIQVYIAKNDIPESYYMLGVFSNFNYTENPFILAASKTYKSLDWIESIVWPGNFGNNDECGELKIDYTTLTAFSSSTFFGEFPWHVVIYTTNSDGSREYLSGGTILNKNTILTAAHVVHNQSATMSPDRLIVSLGNIDLQQQSQVISVKKVIPHEHFDYEFIVNDIALLKLTHLISFSNYIQPICLTNNFEHFQSEIGVVPGWGRNGNKTIERFLKKASLQMIPNTRCRSSNRVFFQKYLNDENFCAEIRDGTNLSRGDSGGGFISKYDGKWYVRGILSGGSKLNDGSSDMEETNYILALVLFTDVVKYYDWIVEKL